VFELGYRQVDDVQAMLDERWKDVLCSLGSGRPAARLLGPPRGGRTGIVGLGNLACSRPSAGATIATCPPSWAVSEYADCPTKGGGRVFAR